MGVGATGKVYAVATGIAISPCSWAIAWLGLRRGCLGFRKIGVWVWGSKRRVEGLGFKLEGVFGV